MNYPRWPHDNDPIFVILGWCILGAIAIGIGMLGMIGILALLGVDVSPVWKW